VEVLGVLSTVLVTGCRPELNLTMLTLFTYAGSNVIHRDRPLKCSPSLVQLEVVQLYSESDELETALLLVQVDVVLAQTVTVMGLPARSVGRKPTVAWCNGPV
jgi:hypothetical protein